MGQNLENIKRYHLRFAHAQRTPETESYLALVQELSILIHEFPFHENKSFSKMNEGVKKITFMSEEKCFLPTSQIALLMFKI